MELPYAEPYKIKMVEHIKRSTQDQRLKWIQEADYTFLRIKFLLMF
jgi:tryptophanase